MIALYCGLDYAVETDREQIQRRLKEMATALQAHNVDALFANVSDNFRTPEGGDKKYARDRVVKDIHNVASVVVWNFQFKGRPTPGKDFDGLRFTFKVKGLGAGSDELPFDGKPTFEHDPAKGWRLKRFAILDSGKADEAEIKVPGW